MVRNALSQVFDDLQVATGYHCVPFLSILYIYHVCIYMRASILGLFCDPQIFHG